MPSSTLLKFSLRIGELPEDQFRIYEFTLEESLSECYKLHVEAGCEDGDIHYNDLIGKKAVLKVSGEEYETDHYGVVTEFNHTPGTGENFNREVFLYSITIEPKLRLLAYSSHNRIFQQKDISEIITEMLQDAGFQALEFLFEASGPFPRRPIAVQYNETDLDFLNRSLEEEGIFYYFDHSGATEKVVFANRSTSYQPVPNTPTLPYLTEAGLSHMQKDHVMRVRRFQKMISGKVLVKDYNHDTPNINVIGRSAGGGEGEIYQFAPQASTPDEADRLAQLKREMLAAEKNIMEGEGIARSFRPGYRFRLEGAGPGFDGELALTRVVHHGNQREGFEGGDGKIIYSNRFSCIPSATQYRPQLHTAKPKINGIITARVDGQESQYAYLDDQGRYRAKLPYDLTDLAEGGASPPIPKAQPYAGPNYGMHFPLHTGNDLILAFIDGDVDRPIAIGVLPNPSNGSPVTSRNKAENIIRTATGHQLRMDDTQDRTALDLTSHGLHKISLNDDADSKEIRLKSTDQNEIVLDDTNQNILIRTKEGGHTLKLDNQNTILTMETKYGHKLTLDDASKSIGLQTKDGHMLKLDDQGKTLTMSDGEGKHIFQIDAQSGAVSITTEGDIRFKAQGAFQVEAGEIQMETKQGAMNVKSAQDFNLQAMNVNGKADMDMNLEGGVGANLKGLNTVVEASANLDVKAGAMGKVTGAMMNVEASGINTIKGAMVMIN
jgi:type VI secretion system secreted protein VgrG